MCDHHHHLPPHTVIDSNVTCLRQCICLLIHLLDLFYSIKSILQFWVCDSVRCSVQNYSFCFEKITKTNVLLTTSGKNIFFVVVVSCEDIFALRIDTYIQFSYNNILYIFAFAYIIISFGVLSLQ